MNDQEEAGFWTEAELATRLDQVRDELLDFLHERTRLDWFKHKVRWRLSRQYIWPAADESRRVMLDEAVEDDVSVEAFGEHLTKRHSRISEAIERYNHALRRYTEVRLGMTVDQFDETELEALRRQRITFQGVRDELRWRAREVKFRSAPDLIPELLSLRLAILVEEVRNEVFSQVAATVADEYADATGDVSPAERDFRALQIEQRMRCLDRYHVTRLLAENYSEGRRFMHFDALLEQYKSLAGELRDAEDDPQLAARVELYHEVLGRSLKFLEEIFPASAGTHDRVMALLRQAPVRG